MLLSSLFCICFYEIHFSIWFFKFTNILKSCLRYLTFLLFASLHAGVASLFEHKKSKDYSQAANREPKGKHTWENFPDFPSFIWRWKKSLKNNFSSNIFFVIKFIEKCREMVETDFHHVVNIYSLHNDRQNNFFFFFWCMKSCSCKWKPQHESKTGRGCFWLIRSVQRASFDAVA